jgi:hypothetical protein
LCRGTKSHGERDESHKRVPLRIVDKRIPIEKVSWKILIGEKNPERVTRTYLKNAHAKPPRAQSKDFELEILFFASLREILFFAKCF